MTEVKKRRKVEDITPTPEQDPFLSLPSDLQKYRLSEFIDTKTLGSLGSTSRLNEMLSRHELEKRPKPTLEARREMINILRILENYKKNRQIGGFTFGPNIDKGELINAYLKLLFRHNFLDRYDLLKELTKIVGREVVDYYSDFYLATEQDFRNFIAIFSELYPSPLSRSIAFDIIEHLHSSKLDTKTKSNIVWDEFKLLIPYFVWKDSLLVWILVNEMTEDWSDEMRQKYNILLQEEKEIYRGQPLTLSKLVNSDSEGIFLDTRPKFAFSM